jgi:chitin disaccharide deacetylase
MLIVNADDWGRNKSTTDNTMVCFQNGRITSASAMVFMENSERAAEMALEADLDTGLHLNFIEPFNGVSKCRMLIEYQGRIASFLKAHKYASLLYNPLLTSAFEYVYRAQYEEYERLYKKKPTHFDGHHHMHLCSNVLWQTLIPKRSKVRRSFSFTSTEKSVANRLYRSLLDSLLMRRYRCVDFFFSIEPVQNFDRFCRILKLSLSHDVELMVHPEKSAEYSYLLSAEYREAIQGAKMGSYRMLRTTGMPVVVHTEENAK